MNILMKKKLRIIAIMLILIMSIGMVSCNKEDSRRKDDSNNEVKDIFSEEENEHNLAGETTAVKDTDETTDIFGKVDDSKITEFTIHGMKVDVTKYADMLKYENIEDGWNVKFLSSIMPEFDKYGIRMNPQLIGVNERNVISDYEFSSETEENYDLYRGISYKPFIQREENVPYGIEFVLSSPKMNDERANFDFTMAYGISEKDLAADYEKNGDFARIIGPIARSADYVKFDLNKLNTEFGKSYMAIYLDGKAVDIESFRDETEKLIPLIDEEEGFQKLQAVFNPLVNNGPALQTLAGILTPISLELQLKNPNIKATTVSIVRQSEIAGLAGVRSVEKLMSGEAKEMVVVIAEESYSGMGRELTAEERRIGEVNMNMYYLYITK